MPSTLRIGLLADTHDRVPAVAEFLRRFAEAGVTLVLHAGDYCAPFALRPFAAHDIPLLGVYGDNDGDRPALAAVAGSLPAGGEISDAPHSIEVDGQRILLVHDLAETRTRSLDAHAFVVRGHSHHAQVQERGRTLIVNPGEACGWISGTPSAAILDLATRRVDFLQLSGPEWGA
jgi:hypothetical protein